MDVTPSGVGFAFVFFIEMVDVRTPFFQNFFIDRYL